MQRAVYGHVDDYLLCCVPIVIIDRAAPSYFSRVISSGSIAKYIFWAHHVADGRDLAGHSRRAGGRVRVTLAFPGNVCSKKIYSLKEAPERLIHSKHPCILKFLLVYQRQYHTVQS